MYQKCSFYLWIQNTCRDRWCSHGFTFRTGFSGHFYDWTWKLTSTYIDQIYDIWETICWWYDLFCENRYHWIVLMKIFNLSLKKKTMKYYHFWINLISRGGNDITKVYWKSAGNYTWCVARFGTKRLKTVCKWLANTPF